MTATRDRLSPEDRARIGLVLSMTEEERGDALCYLVGSDPALFDQISEAVIAERGEAR